MSGVADRGLKQIFCGAQSAAGSGCAAKRNAECALELGLERPREWQANVVGIVEQELCTASWDRLRSVGPWRMAGEDVRKERSVPRRRWNRLRPLRQRPDHAIRPIRFYRPRDGN